MRSYAESQEKLLNTYGWIDRQNGIVRLPIDRAMELLLERGLPTPEPAAESVMIAPWPQFPTAWQDPAMEQRMARMQGLVRAIREREETNWGPDGTLKSLVLSISRSEAAAGADRLEGFDGYLPKDFSAYDLEARWVTRGTAPVTARAARERRASRQKVPCRPRTNSRSRKALAYKKATASARVVAAQEGRGTL